MDIVNVLANFLSLFLLPAAIVFAAVILSKKYFEFNEKNKHFKLRERTFIEVLPKKLHAYERMVLFLERISPSSLVMRTHKAGMSAKLLQTELLRSIREEYEHNLAQQIYISGETWALIKNTKDEMAHLINVSAEKAGDDATGVELAQMIFRISGELGKLPTDTAIAQLRKEIQKLV
ncbi:MAG: hypothetical protein ACLGGV_07900 [Bacteroidia bacterium]